MGAYMNALREEGTKEDCLIQIERLLDERAKLQARLAEAVEVVREICWYDWSNNDDDAVETIEAARAFLAKLEGRS